MAQGTMMDMPLTIHQIVDRAERYLADTEVVSRRADKALHRTTYGAIVGRGRRLARALIAAGIAPGDRVATLMWNHAEHLEAYAGIPLSGGVLHTLNLRLHPDEIAYIATDARDRFLIVDETLLPLYDKVRVNAAFERVFVVRAGTAEPGSWPAPLEDYEAFLAGAPAATPLPAIGELDALGVCYTSGTTGKPKGVVYTHRSTLLHTIVCALPDAIGCGRADTMMPVVPMFHANAWGFPFIAMMVGAKLVFPGPHLDAENLIDLMERERVTIAGGVPTIWIGVRDAIDAKPRDLVPGMRMMVGGSAAPEQLIRDFDRQGLHLVHAWGMTETSPVATVSRVPPAAAGASDDTKYKLRARQGTPLPLVDIRVRNEAGDVPADDTTSGELLVRGPWVAGSYAGNATPERWTEDGFFRTGDVCRVDAHGFIQLTDRTADLIKSGGEWIASQEVENALMCHPAVREAAVIGVPHPKWSERPLAAIVLKAGVSATPDELRAFLAPKFPKFWLPDAYVVVEAIPRTSAGKFKKSELREMFRSHSWT
jgi:fatty-acyl-CoA synthase